MGAAPTRSTGLLQYDYEITINDCSVDTSEVVDRIRGLMKRGGTRFLVRIPEGSFVECLDVIRRIHQSFLFISLSVVEGSTPPGVEVVWRGR
ncbi:MAG: hypothetical protein F7C07_08320 [Desulfurococcales archaeon]|nr:hypothetical protein [Desulfurococcales archaeon]